MATKEELERSRIIYQQVVNFDRHLRSAYTALAGASIDSVEEKFAGRNIRDLKGAMNIMLKAAIDLRNEWDGYYQARASSLLDESTKGSEV